MSLYQIWRMDLCFTPHYDRAMPNSLKGHLRLRHSATPSGLDARDIPLSLGLYFAKTANDDHIKKVRLGIRYPYRTLTADLSNVLRID